MERVTSQQPVLLAQTLPTVAAAAPMAGCQKKISPTLSEVRTAPAAASGDSTGKTSKQRQNLAFVMMLSESLSI
jgi:hypothetical protein